MNLDWVQLLGALFTTTAAGYVLDRITRPPGKLIFAALHVVEHEIPVKNTDAQETPLTTVFTRNLVVQNAGRGTIDDIEIIFEFPPQNFQLDPVIVHESSILNDGRFLLKVPMLSSKEIFVVEMIGNGIQPLAQSVRFRGGVGKPQPFIYMPAPKKWLVWGLLSAAALGLFAIMWVGVGLFLPLFK